MSITKENLEERFNSQQEELEKAEAQVSQAETNLEDKKALRERIIGSLASLQELYQTVIQEEETDEVQDSVEEIPPPKKTTKRGKK